MTCRAYSLYQEGTLRFAAGDMEAAYRRFSQLMPILAQPLEPILVRISLLFERPVVPPSRAECAWLACRVCEATGRQEEAQAYRQMHADLAGSDSANLVPAELAAEANLDDLAALDVVRKLKYAMSLMRAQPLEALTVLASARAALTGDGEPRLAARLDYAEGSCHLLLRDYPAAAAEFEQALAALPDRTDAAVQIDCHQGLAFIAAADGRYADAYEHLRECVKLIERYRTSLPRVEDRMAFLRDRIPIYELLVRCCIALNLRVEAFTAVQRVKSRSLADLLAQPAHQPIDYALEGQAALLRTDREDWVAEHIGDTYTWGQDFGDPEEYEKSREYQMLTRSIRRSEQEKDLVEERHVRGLLEKLQEQATELDFTVVRELLRM
jgi:tetratricopeptide (TPR) repeat protein